MFRAFAAATLMVLSVAAQDSIQPFVLAYTAQQALAQEIDSVRGKLRDADLQVIGEYAPWEGAYVLAVTSPEMLALAAKTPHGGFGAVNHVALTQVADGVQVSYLNPAYMAAAYRMQGAASTADQTLRKVLGASREFGSAEGRSDADLREYHYMFGMEYFPDVYELASYSSHAEAVETIEQNLAKQVAGAAQVYRIAIPGTQQVLFGVSRAKVEDKRANDAHILRDTVDEKAELKTTPYLPYQMLVDDEQAMALHMRFRMAVYHPDLTMGTFGKLMASPGAIEDLLRKVAGGKAKTMNRLF